MVPPTFGRRDVAPTPTKEGSGSLRINCQLLDLIPIRGRVFVRVRGAGRGKGNTVHSKGNRRWDGDATDLEAGLGDGDAIERRAVRLL